MIDNIYSRIAQKIKEDKSKENIINYNFQNIVVGDGKFPNEYVIIGEAPGAMEDVSGIPFVGRSGALLSFVFSNFNVERKDIFITNAFFIRPPGNRAPYDYELELFKEEFIDLILFCNPKKIMCLGKTACTFLDKNSSYFNNVLIIQNYHPSYILRSGGVNGNFFKIFKDKFNLFFH